MIEETTLPEFSAVGYSLGQFLLQESDPLTKT